MTSTPSIGRYLRTVRHLAPAQIVHRVRLRTRRSLYRRRPDGLEQRWAEGAPSTGSWPADFLPIDRRIKHRPPDDDGTIHLVGEEHRPMVDGWRPTERSQLFRYHLHYFDWAWGLADLGDRSRFGELWTSWQEETMAGRWDEWSPYVVSMRAWTLCATFDDLARDTAIEEDVIDHLRACFGFLQRNLEQDVGGNHLLKNLKALIGLAVFFGLDDRLALAVDRFRTQLDIQVLTDGGHYELSPSYHVQVLGDLIDVDSLLAGEAPYSVPPTLIDRMTKWLAAMTYPDGSLPMVGDSTPPPAGLIPAIFDAHPKGHQLLELARDEPVKLLPNSGYVVARPHEHTMIVIDMGRPCPPRLPAHAQADWGNFEVWLQGRRIVLDPGVSTYVGERRAWERSTTAHNTVCIDQTDQTEVWGSFRAGTRARPSDPVVMTRCGVISIEAEVRGAPRGVHRRRFEIEHDVMHVFDRVTMDRFSKARPSISIINVSSDEIAADLSPQNAITRSAVDVGIGFGRTQPAVRVEQQVANQTAGWSIPLGTGHSPDTGTLTDDD